MAEEDLPHLTAHGEVHMVDVGDKPETRRTAKAEGFIQVRPEVLRVVQEGQAAKGDVLAVARVAAIMAAKRTAEWIPLCHPIALTGVDISIGVEEAGIRVLAETRTSGQTGVEMEALTAVSAACLTIYDMLKASDRGMTIGPVRLLAKSGGRTGQFIAQDGEGEA